MRRSRLPVVVALVILSAVVLVWAARRPLTEAAVARWFTAQGVEARYRITALSPTAVTLTGVSIGPVARPDFTAARIDAAVGWSPLRPRIETIRLVRPELRATLGEHGISFGSLDRLLRRTGPAQPLPDIDLTIVDGRLQVATAAGTLAGGVEGGGRLGGGFSGRWLVAPTALAAGGCATTLTGGTVVLATGRDDVRVTATGLLPRLACAQGRAAVVWRIAATLPPTLDSYSAQLDAQATDAMAGRYGARRLHLRGGASAATLDAPIAGTANVEAEGLAGPSLRIARLTAAGPYRVDPGGSGSATATVTVSRASTALTTLAMRKISRRLAGTLAQPLYDRLLDRGGAAARSFDATAAVALRRDARGVDVELTALTARATTGARLGQTGRARFSAGRFTVAGGVAVSGGGLPVLTLTATGSVHGGKVEGVATLAALPWAVPGAALEALRVEARGSSGQMTLTGLVRASGALGGGIKARRLGLSTQLAFSPNGDATLGQRCLIADWAGLSRDDLVVGPGTARVCPVGGAIASFAGGRIGGRSVVAPLRLRGRSAATPLSLDTGALHLALSGTAARPHLTIGATPIAAEFGDARAAATLDGSFALTDASGTGTLAALRFDHPGSPVTITAGAGRWRLARGRLELANGTARVADRNAPARFEPLRLDRVSAVLANGLLEAHGSGKLASTGARLFDFTASHTLASGRGAATVETGTLRFGAELQPYQVTEALRGVVENVVGPVEGSGRFAWTGSTLTSRGSLAIDHVSLATATLGPVDDIAGTLAFDDLLALTTLPGQRLTIKRINPGVAVEDGVVHFRMLGPDAAAIENIVWPYAGGTLTLAPVTIRAGDATRTFLLTVDGLDAQQFLQKFEIKNLNVSGLFDGRLPLVFADGKGRVVAGTMTARPGGGLVQYVGAVGGEDLGAGARLAFDALRRLRYRSLSLTLDGDLDGELVTQLRFTGTNEAAATLGGGPLPIRATGLPFRFNVTVRAPFRALLGTASSFSDVRPLIRPAAGVQPQ